MRALTNWERDILKDALSAKEKAIKNPITGSISPAENTRLRLVASVKELVEEGYICIKTNEEI